MRGSETKLLLLITKEISSAKKKQIMDSCYSKIYGRRWISKTTSPATQISLISISVCLPVCLQKHSNKKKFQTSKQQQKQQRHTSSGPQNAGGETLGRSRHSKSERLRAPTETDTHPSRRRKARRARDRERERERLCIHTGMYTCMYLIHVYRNKGMYK